MPADDAPIGLADFLLTRDIFGFVGDVPGQPHEMTRLAARLGQHRDDVRKRLLDLGDKIVADQLAVLIPADLSGNENLAAVAAMPLA